MKQPIKLLLGVVAAASATGLAFFGWSVKAKDEATIQLANGVQVTPVEVKSDDMAELLDVKMWKFDITLSRGKSDCIFPIDLYKNGKFVQSLGGVSSSASPDWTGERHEKLFVGMIPIGGDFMHATQIKAKYGYEEHGVYIFSTNTFVNPFLPASSHLSKIEPTAKPQSAEKNGGICLMSGSVETGEQERPFINVELVMTVQEQPKSH